MQRSITVHRIADGRRTPFRSRPSRGIRHRENSSRFPIPGPVRLTKSPPKSQGITARYTAGDRGVLQLFGEPAQGRVARRVVTDLLAKQFPKAVVDYELPNAMVGYQLGYGVVANFQRPGLANRFDMRVVIIAAVKNDLALVAVAEGPFRRFSRDFGLVRRLRRTWNSPSTWGSTSRASVEGRSTTLTHPATPTPGRTNDDFPQFPQRVDSYCRACCRCSAPVAVVRRSRVTGRR